MASEPSFGPPTQSHTVFRTKTPRPTPHRPLHRPRERGPTVRKPPLTTTQHDPAVSTSRRLLDHGSTNASTDPRSTAWLRPVRVRRAPVTG